MNAPPLDWADIEGLAEVIAALGGGSDTRLVGGCVRDRLLGLPIGDVDLATRHLPDAVIAKLTSAGLRAIPTGIDHGTVTALSGGRAFEITTLRHDIETDGRRAVVAYSDDWTEDAARRDFTINALYSDAISGDVFDPVGGLRDIPGPAIRFIGEPSQRIAEDHLRILRYFRFLARFSVREADAVALQACHDARNNLMTLSRERIAGELLRIFDAEDPSYAAEKMQEIRLFGSFLPEIADDIGGRMRALVAIEQANALIPRPERRLGLGLPMDAKLLEKLSARLKFSNRVKKALCDTARATGDIGTLTPRGLVYRHGRDAAMDALAIDAALNAAAPPLESLADWVAPQLPIKGGELIRLGIAPGPLVSTTLAEIERRWIAQDFATDDRFDVIVREAVAQALDQ